MKNTIRNIIWGAAIIFALPTYGINYPTYKGPSLERFTRSGDINVPLRADPLPKPTAGNLGNDFTLFGNSTAGTVYNTSDQTKQSSGGGASVASSSSNSQKVNPAVTGSTGGGFALPRMKSVTNGSSFESDDVTLADGYKAGVIRGDVLPPPPPEGGDDENTQLPLGDGIGVLLLLCGAWLIRNLKLGIRN